MIPAKLLLIAFSFDWNNATQFVPVQAVNKWRQMQWINSLSAVISPAWTS